MTRAMDVLIGGSRSVPLRVLAAVLLASTACTAAPQVEPVQSPSPAQVEPAASRTEIVPDANDPVVDPGSALQADTADITDASALRNELLALASQTGSEAEDPEDADAVVAAVRARWSEENPGLRQVIPEVPADPGRVSVFVEPALPDPDGRASPTNVPFLAFTTADTSGRCAGGVVRGFPRITASIEPIDMSGTVGCFAVVVAALLYPEAYDI